MIGVPRDFEPSSLLYYGQIPEDVQRLLTWSRDARLGYEWIQARERALHVCDIYKGTAHAGLALAQMHLADFYGDVGEIGEATTWCEKAHWIFQRQPSRAQQHNEAVATYALGILLEQRLFGDPMGAWNLYQRALRQFQAAQEYWATCNNILQFEKCQLVRRYISQRSQKIMARYLDYPSFAGIVQTRPVEKMQNSDAELQWQTVSDVWDPSDTRPFWDKNQIQGYILEDTGGYFPMVEQEEYWPHPTAAHPENVAPDVRDVNHYSAPRTPKNRWTDIEAKPGGPAHTRVVWVPTAGWSVVDSERAPDKVKSTSSSSRIIGQAAPGDPNEKPAGYIIGLLKPE